MKDFVDLGNSLGKIASMKLFVVYVSQRTRPRAVDTSKFVVMAESGEKAIEAVKHYYPAESRGWHPSANFVVTKVVDSDVAVPV